MNDPAAKKLKIITTLKKLMEKIQYNEREQLQINRRVLQKFGSDAILAFKSPATKLTNQNCDDFGL